MMIRYPLSFPLVGNLSEATLLNELARTHCALGTGINCFPICVIARLDRAIQGKELDFPVEPEDDNIEFDFYALRSWRRVFNKAIRRIPNKSE